MDLTSTVSYFLLGGVPSSDHSRIDSPLSFSSSSFGTVRFIRSVNVVSVVYLASIRATPDSPFLILFLFIVPPSPAS